MYIYKHHNYLGKNIRRWYRQQGCSGLVRGFDFLYEKWYVGICDRSGKGCLRGRACEYRRTGMDGPAGANVCVIACLGVIA